MLAFLLSLTSEEKKNGIEYLYHKFHDDMLRFAKSKFYGAGVGNIQANAEDAVQNSFLKLVRYVDSVEFDSPDKRLQVYLFSIVSNEVINILNDTTLHEDIDKFAEKLSDDEFFERIDIRHNYEYVVERIKLLDEKYSLTLFYYYEHDMSIKEISDMMGIKEKTVYTRLERGRTKLMELLEGATI